MTVGKFTVDSSSLTAWWVMKEPTSFRHASNVSAMLVWRLSVTHDRPSCYFSMLSCCTPLEQLLISCWRIFTITSFLPRSLDSGVGRWPEDFQFVNMRLNKNAHSTVMHKPLMSSYNILKVKREYCLQINGMKNQNKNIWPDVVAGYGLYALYKKKIMPLTVAFGLLPTLFSVYCVYRSQRLLTLLSLASYCL